MKQSDNGLYFRSCTVNSLTIIYERAWFNVLQISNLNKNITTTASSQATFAYHAIDHYRSERKDPDFHALRCESSSFEASLHWSLQSPLHVFFSKSKKDKSTSRQSCNRIDIKMETRTDRIQQLYNVYQNTVRIITISRKKSKNHRIIYNINEYSLMVVDDSSKNNHSN